jgi:hypothetical protein
MVLSAREYLCYSIGYLIGSEDKNLLSSMVLASKVVKTNTDEMVRIMEDIEGALISVLGIMDKHDVEKSS